MPLTPGELSAQVVPAPGEVRLSWALGIGFVLSLLGSLPMTGPLALLVLDRVLMRQRGAALWIAFSGALVEGVVAAVIATLLPLVLQHSTSLVRVGRLSGAVVICVIGLALVLRPQTLAAIETKRRRQSLLLGFLVTALNPTLLATWTIAVTAVHANGLLQGGLREGLCFGLGVVLGVLGWFGALSAIAAWSALERLQRYRAVLGRSVGAVLLLIGAFTLWHSFYSG